MTEVTQLQRPYGHHSLKDLASGSLRKGLQIPGLGHLCHSRVWLSEVRVEGKEVFGGTVDWPGAQEGVCWPKPESPVRGARGQLLGPCSSGFSRKPLTCLQLPTSLRMNLSCLTAS